MFLTSSRRLFKTRVKIYVGAFNLFLNRLVMWEKYGYDDRTKRAKSSHKRYNLRKKTPIYQMRE